jgi:hypothetical protein
MKRRKKIRKKYIDMHTYIHTHTYTYTHTDRAIISMCEKNQIKIKIN